MPVMKCLVTGCAGFVGSHLSDSLLIQGHEVLGIDCFTPYYDIDIKRRNLSSSLSSERFQFVEGDLSELELAPLLEDIEVVFHIAGQPGVRKSWGEEFAAYTYNNVLATERLLHACVKQPIQQLVFAGSSSVYGDAPEMPWRESTCPQPRSPYAITKLAAEHLCNSYRLDFDVPTTVVRYFTVYGPRQRPDMAFHRFFRAILAGKSILLYGNGLQTRDFTFVEDIVEGTIAAGMTPEAKGGVYNLGGGSRIILNDLIDLMRSVVDRPIIIEQLGEQAGDVRHTWADASHSAQVLGWRPKVALAEGLTREYEWMRQVIAGEEDVRNG